MPKLKRTVALLGIQIQLVRNEYVSNAMVRKIKKGIHFSRRQH